MRLFLKTPKETTTLDFGRRNDFDRSVYLRVDRGPVFSAPAALLSQLMAPPERFVEHRLVFLNAEELRQVSLSGPTGGATLTREERAGAPTWSLRFYQHEGEGAPPGPPSEHAHQAQLAKRPLQATSLSMVESFLRRLTNLQAVQVPSALQAGAKASALLSQPRASPQAVFLELVGAGKRSTLRFVPVDGATAASFGTQGPGALVYGSPLGARGPDDQEAPRPVFVTEATLAFLRFDPAKLLRPSESEPPLSPGSRP